MFILGDADYDRPADKAGVRRRVLPERSDARGARQEGGDRVWRRRQLASASDVVGHRAGAGADQAQDPRAAGPAGRREPAGPRRPRRLHVPHQQGGVAGAVALRERALGAQVRHARHRTAHRARRRRGARLRQHQVRQQEHRLPRHRVPFHFRLHQLGRRQANSQGARHYRRTLRKREFPQRDIWDGENRQG